MAATITNFIDRIQLGNDQIAIGSSAYGICNTAAIEPAKTANIPGFYLNPGTTVHIKFNNANSATSPTLNISSTGAKPIIQYNNTPVGIIDETTGWQAGAILTLTYDGTSWVRDQGYNTNTWHALSTSQAGYVSQAPNDTTKFLRGDASWATLPAASDSTAGIMKLGASGGAATYDHNHNATYLTAVGYDSENKKIYYTKNNANTDVVQFGSNAFNSTAYLPLAGGNMTGNIGYTDGTNAKTMIQFVTGNANGHTIKIGGGAATVVAAGESVSLAPTATSENLFLLAVERLTKYLENVKK